MSHGDQVKILPNSFVKIASTTTAPYVAIGNEERGLFGIQFHPEVTHSVQGKLMLKNFVIGICKCNNNWKMDAFIDKEIAKIKSIIPANSHVIGAVSGGVDR